MNKTAEMFLSQLTIVDHAYIDDKGNVIGGSYTPTFFVSGNVDPVEQVVVDFSTIKKDIKNIIDNHSSGFDHKLWVIEGYSKYTCKAVYDVVYVTTPSTDLIMPLDAIKLINIPNSPNPEPSHSTYYIGNAFAAQVQEELRVKYGESIVVTCVNTVLPHLPIQSTYSTFSYVHGLKDSTSYGCQNTNHGHLSYVLCIPNTADTCEAAVDLTKLIAASVNNAIFIKADNILSESDETIVIGYTTVRGDFKASYKKSEYLIIVLETETTVEHLVDYIAERFANELAIADIQTLFVSEGLSKGAMKRFA